MNKKSGFTLIEVLVATILALVVLSASIGFSVTSLNASRRLEMSNTALNLARIKLEEIAKEDFEQILSQSNLACSDALGLVAPDYQAQVLVNDISDDKGNVELKRVTVTVRGIPNSKTSQISETLSTTIAN